MTNNRGGGILKQKSLSMVRFSQELNGFFLNFFNKGTSMALRWQDLDFYGG